MYGNAPKGETKPLLIMYYYKQTLKQLELEAFKNKSLLRMLPEKKL